MRTTMANIPTEVPLTARDRPGPGCGGMGQRYVEWNPGATTGGTMPIFRLNHAVLYVRALGGGVAFYRAGLGFGTAMTRGGAAAFIQAPGSTNDHDLGLFQIGPGAGPSEAGRRTVGLYHLAWEGETLAELERLAARRDE